MILQNQNRSAWEMRTKFVRPEIGSGGDGHTFPGAAYPFGLVQPSPDTGREGYRYCAGYRYEDDRILGFSQTHLSGTGCGDLGDIRIMPFVTCGRFMKSPSVQA